MKINRKYLAIGLIILFIGAGIIPAVNGLSIKKDKNESETFGDNGIIHGYVYVNFKKYEGARLRLYKRFIPLELIDETTSDSNGFYEFRNLEYSWATGTWYWLYVNIPGKEMRYVIWLNQAEPIFELNIYLFKRSKEKTMTIQNQIVNLANYQNLFPILRYIL